MIKIPIVEVTLVRDGSVKAESREADNPAKVDAIVREYLGEVDREHLVLLMLNARSKVVGINTVSVGTLTASLVSPREVFKPAILGSSAAILIAHNHPSSDPTPSPEDKDATRRILQAGQLLGIPLLDHIIVAAGGGFFSFREHGLIS